MSKLDLSRQTAIVRNHLKQVVDAPADAVDIDETTLTEVAKQMVTPIDDLRAFRDGQDAALAPGVVAAWSRLIGTGGPISLGDVESSIDSWFRAKYANEENIRQSRFDHYDTIEKTRPEAESAQTAWADMVVFGSVDGILRGGAFVPEPLRKNDSLRKTLTRIADRINTSLLPDSQKHCLVRDMAKNGSQFEQIGLDRFSDGIHVSELKPMPVREMRVMPTPTPLSTYGRFAPGATSPVAEWPAWKMIHFANKKSRSDRYGWSIYEANLRSWVQVEAMEGGMITRRLERAPQRFKWKINTADCAGDEKEKRKRIEFYKSLYKKQRTVDGSSNYQNQRITPTAGEDFYVPKSSENDPTDVEAIPGDAHLAEIADFLHFFNKWLSGLGPPKHHLGYEAETMRSVGTELHIVFARKARRMQTFFMQGLNHLYWIELLLQGIDPRTARYILVPPAMATRDELVGAQIMQAYATTVKALADAFSNTTKMPSVEWFLRWIMGIDEEALSDGVLDLVPTIQKGKKGGDKSKDGPSLTPQEQQGAIAQVMADPKASAEIRYARHFMDERRISRMSADELVQNGIIAPGDLMPSIDVKAFCERLKIKHLREAA